MIDIHNMQMHISVEYIKIRIN